LIFYCTVLGKKQEFIIKQINELRNTDEYITASLVRYFLVHQIVIDNLDFYVYQLGQYNFAFSYITAYLTFINKKGVNLNLLANNAIIEAVINYDKTSNDEVRSEFIYQGIKEMIKGRLNISETILKYLLSQFNDYKSFTIYNSYFKIYDSLALCITQQKLGQEIYSIIQNIFQTQNDELYPLSIQLLALLVHHGIIYPEMQSIFSTEALWTSKPLLIPMTLLAIALHRKNIVDKTVLQNLCDFLITKDTFVAYLLLENIKMDNDNEYFTYAMTIASKKIAYDGFLILLSKIGISDERYNLAVNKCLDELLVSVVGKRSLNRVIKACHSIGPRMDKQSKEKIDALVVRNEGRVGEFENVLETVIEVFEL